VWDFPTQVKGQPMRCWGIYDANLLSDQKRPLLKEPLCEELAHHGFALDDYELQGHPIRWFEPFNKFSVPRVLLVGDAAGADPLFGEGISIALGYGLLAAREVESAFSTGDFSFSGYKHRLVQSALGGTLFARWFIANIFYSLKWRWFQFLVWRILKPIVLLIGWIFILNWGKRLKT
jgi:flavin-dependent dehydrogenase